VPATAKHKACQISWLWLRSLATDRISQFHFLVSYLPKSLFFITLGICSCQQAAPLPKQTPNSTAILPSPTFSEEPATAAPPAPPVSQPRLARKTIRGISFEGVSFDSRTHRLRVIDQPLGPGSVFETSQSVAQRHGALLAINAGFFTPEGKPLGLVVSDGQSSGAWNSASSLGSGIFAENASGALTIFRRSNQSHASGARELIQAGPLLLENGKAISGLDASKPALRSILLTDGGSRWWIGITSSCSLANLSAALAAESPAPWRSRNALNLDGGRSTDLFISPTISGHPVNRRGLLNRPVRNFLILKPR
jgi:Phosphodiester glycosidase